MRTTFRPRSNAGASSWKRFGFVITVLIIGAVLFSIFRSPIISFARPVWEGENALSNGVGNVFGFFRSKNALINENQMLKDRLEDFESLGASYRALESSREEILSSFGRSPLEPAVSAGVLVHPPHAPYDILIIDAGIHEGVEVGDRVSLPLGGALGRISAVYEREARVELYSGGNVETSAILERGDVPVLLIGRGGGTFETTLPRDVSVEPGDKILLPGIRAELVGVVREVELEAADSEKRVIAGGVGNISSLRFVLVQ